MLRSLHEAARWCNIRGRGTDLPRRGGVIAERERVLSDIQLEAAEAAELRALRERVDAELARRERDRREEGRIPPPGGEGPPSREVVGQGRPGGSGYYQLEKVRCGKKGCRKCAEGAAHGPYLYRYFRKDGRMTSEYINNSPEHVVQADQAGLYEAAGVKPPRS
jgi:hypothetical protein